MEKEILDLLKEIEGVTGDLSPFVKYYSDGSGQVVVHEDENANYFEDHKELISLLKQIVENSKKSNMELNDYQKKAVKTRSYGSKIALTYIALGIAGEASELHEKMVKLSNKEVVSKDEIKKEIGDIAWYIALWCEETNIKMGSLKTDFKFDAILDVNYSGLHSKLVFHAGQVAEQMKKALHKFPEMIEQKTMPEDRLSKVNISMANLLNIIEATAYFYNIDFYECLSDNLEKLSLRKKTGKIVGDGDYR